MTRVFISYRRADTSDIVDALDQELVDVYGRSQIYRDVKSIQPGTDWLDAVQRSVLSSDILLAVVGANWVGKESSGERRIDDRRDAVRLEVATALEAKMSILPVRAEGATMPKPEDVPLDVSKVTRINALPLSNEQFISDVGMILSAIGELTARRPRQSLVQRIASRRFNPGPLVGTWVSTGGGDALLQYTFHGDGTYEFAGGLRQERASGSMVFEAYQAGEYRLKGRALLFTAFRSSTSRRDPDFPEEDYVNRPERVKNSELRWELTGKESGRVLVLTDADKQTTRYTRL